MQHIETRKELIAFAKKYGLRPDWHEPDEQGVSVTMKGKAFDNAYGSSGFHNFAEKTVVLSIERKPVAMVNLASLFAWAAGYTDERAYEDYVRTVTREKRAE